jgi:polysaccharide biosynthesis transport protein
VLARTQLSPVGNTVLLKLTTTGDTPEQAVALGYAYIEELRRSISALEAVSGGLVSRVDLVPVQPPSIQGHAGMFPTWMILGAAGALGLMAGAFAAVVVALLDGRIHRAEDAAEATATPVLATFRSSVRWEESVLKPLDGESGRQLRGTFDRLAIVGSKVVMVASAEDGAGKTGIALIAARVLADRGSAVAFLDFDSRGSRLASALELEDQESVVARVRAAVAEDQRPPRMQTLPRANWHGVTIIPFGAADEDAGAIADHPGTGTTMEALRRTYDWVIVDTPAATDFSDASRLVRHVDAVVLVAKASHSSFDELRVVSDQLRLAGGRLSGVVFVDNAQVDRR